MVLSDRTTTTLNDSSGDLSETGPCRKTYEIFALTFGFDKYILRIIPIIIIDNFQA